MHKPIKIKTPNKGSKKCFNCIHFRPNHWVPHHEATSTAGCARCVLIGLVGKDYSCKKFEAMPQGEDLVDYYEVTGSRVDFRGRIL